VETHNTPSASYTTLLKPFEVRLALRDLLGANVANEIIEGKRAVITTCGSGMTAAILWLGLKLIGAQKVGLYDEVCLI
jgi:thiosulfate/3-mercaptopyruvate sulfurtransferase